MTFPADEWGRLYQECGCGVQLIARHAPPAAERDPVAAPPALARRPQHRPQPSARMRAIVGAIVRAIGRGVRRGDGA